MTVVNTTDRPKLVFNCCVIKVLVAFFMLSRCFLDFSVGVEAFDIEMSQISSFFSSHVKLIFPLFKLHIKSKIPSENLLIPIIEA